MSTYLRINYGPWPDFEEAEPGPPLEVIGRIWEKYTSKMDRTVAIVKRLEADGWEFEAGEYYATARHAAVTTTAAAEQRLAAIGVGPADVTVVAQSDGSDEGPTLPSALLYFLPWENDFELEEGDKMGAEEIRRLAASQRRSISVARRLRADGWDVWYTRHGLEADRQDLLTAGDIRARLAALGIPSGWMCVG